MTLNTRGWPYSVRPRSHGGMRWGENLRVSVLERPAYQPITYGWGPAGNDCFAPTGRDHWIGPHYSPTELADVCYSDSLGLYCAVGPVFSISRTGWAWEIVDNPIPGKYWYAVCRSDKLGLFLAVSGYNDGQDLATSPDGRNWTLISTPTGGNFWYLGCWSEFLQKFVVLGSSQMADDVLLSSDGITFTQGTMLPGGNLAQGYWYGMCSADELGLLVAVGSYNSCLAISRDGLAWEAPTYPIPNMGLASIAWGNEMNKLCVVAPSATFFNDKPTFNACINGMLSNDGRNWRIFYSDEAWSPNKVCWSRSDHCFAVVEGLDPINRVQTSSDGFQWTRHLSKAANYYSVAPGPTGFCAVGTPPWNAPADDRFSILLSQ